MTYASVKHTHPMSHEDARIAAGDVESADETPTDGAVDVVDEPADGDKPLKSLKVDELRDRARTLGVKPDIAEGLTKAELVDVIERMTASSDD